jgi:hydroxymethylpyrimidine pyrophosphatase-like HAD family hydrolase
VGDDVFVERMSREAEFTRTLNRLDPRLVPDLAAFVASGPTKMVFVRLPEIGPSLVGEVQAAFIGEILAFSSVKQYCEIIHPDADKGKALRALARRLEIPIEQVAAIGDGDNDLTLLGAAGLPLAMGNATPGLKAIARHVVGTVEDAGVAEAIEKFVLAS